MQNLERDERDHARRVVRIVAENARRDPNCAVQNVVGVVHEAQHNPRQHPEAKPEIGPKLELAIDKLLGDLEQNVGKVVHGHNQRANRREARRKREKDHSQRGDVVRKHFRKVFAPRLDKHVRVDRVTVERDLEDVKHVDVGLRSQTGIVSNQPSQLTNKPEFPTIDTAPARDRTQNDSHRP